MSRKHTSRTSHQQTQLLSLDKQYDTLFKEIVHLKELKKEIILTSNDKHTMRKRMQEVEAEIQQKESLLAEVADDFMETMRALNEKHINPHHKDDFEDSEDSEDDEIMRTRTQEYKKKESSIPGRKQRNQSNGRRQRQHLNQLDSSTLLPLMTRVRAL